MKKIVLSLVLIILIFQTTKVFGRYYGEINNITVRSEIAEPIILVEKMQEERIEIISVDSEIKEYYFKIKNCKGNRVSEIDFDINIQVRNSNSNCAPSKG